MYSKYFAASMSSAAPKLTTLHISSLPGLLASSFPSPCNSSALISSTQSKRGLVISRRLASYLLALPFTPLRPCPHPPSTRYPAASGRVLNMATAASLDLEMFGKAASGSGSPSKERGDCPFSQRIYLHLEEKGLSYTATYIEEGPNKPDWFMAKNPKGLMPLLRDGEQWIQDSDKIAQHLEEKYPQRSLKTPANFKQVGSGLFPAFTSWLKSKKVEDPSKQEYLKELRALNDHLQANGPFIAGKEPTDSDFALAPKLRHARVALQHYMGFTIPKEYTAVLKYIELIEARPSFRKTDSPDDMIIQGWGKKFDLQKPVAKEPQHV